jgi:ribosomal protein L11 methyltransferase
MKKTPVFEYYPDKVVIPISLADGTKRIIEINPGWAFGKGFHSTTKLCIKTLEYIYSNHDTRGPAIDKMLDVGCGSGILSICAAALGATKVTGLDIDNIIVNEACENVSINGLESQIDIVLGSIQDIPGSFDLVAANILTGSMLPISSELKNKVKPGGLLLLSGIKDTESDIVLERFFERGLFLVHKDIDKEWVVLLLRA